VSEDKATVHVRLYPTSDQAALLRAHCQEYITTINVLTRALDAGILPEPASTKDFTAALPSAVKNQALRDARAVVKRALALGRLPRLRKPICHWNNQNWRLESQAEGDHLVLPVFQCGKVGQIAIRCALHRPLTQEGTPGLLRVKRKRGKWMVEIAFTLPTPEPTSAHGIMGIDLGIKIPAVVHVIGGRSGKGERYFGNGRNQRFHRCRFYYQRKTLQQAGKTRAVKARQGKERRWMRAVNHTLSHRIVIHAQQQGVGIIRLEHLVGIRQGITQHTARTSGGASGRHAAKRMANARKNNRMKNTWAFFQLTAFITYKAERLGMLVEAVDPAYTSQTCPACAARNHAADRRYVCATCGWQGHRDVVGAINISRRAGAHGDSARATGA